MDRAGDLLRVTERIYAAALTPAEWSAALAGMGDLLHGDHTTMYAQGTAGGAPFLACAGIDPGEVARAVANYEKVSAGPLAFGALPLGRVFTRAQLMPDREFARSAYYNEIVRPMKGFHSAATWQLCSAAAILVNVCRGPDFDDFDAVDLATLRLLVPHLTTAIELQQRLQAADGRSAALARTLDRLETGVILTDAAGRPACINAPAARIVADADGFAVDDDGIALATATATRALHAAIAAAAMDVAVESRRIRVERPSHRPPLMLTVIPVWRLGATVPGAGAPQVAVFITEPDAPVAIDRVAIAEAFRLTRRESEVTALLATGSDLEAIASRLGLGLPTVRAHLQHVFEKTGARSQAALVALLRGFVDRLQ